MVTGYDWTKPDGDGVNQGNAVGDIKEIKFNANSDEIELLVPENKLPIRYILFENLFRT